VQGLERPNVISIDIGPPGAPELLEGEAATAWLRAAAAVIDCDV
jgi:hypothetical protein